MFGVATDRVRVRCGLVDLTEDARINNLIGEMVPALARFIAPSAMADETLHPILNLAATELIAAEMLGILSREPGKRDGIVLGDLRIEPEYDDGAVLRAQGERRLAPFVRPGLMPRAGVAGGGDRSGEETP